MRCNGDALGSAKKQFPSSAEEGWPKAGVVLARKISVHNLQRTPMILAKVIGQVIATQKEPSHEGKKILLVQALTLAQEPTGDPFVAFDAVDAGIGDRVLAVQEGFSAMTSVGHSEAPIDAAVIGVVDRVELA
jgi:ethanolamine utilization protein EutN